jgi:hypothetical protein
MQRDMNADKGPILSRGAYTKLSGVARALFGTMF